MTTKTFFYNGCLFIIDYVLSTSHFSFRFLPQDRNYNLSTDAASIVLHNKMYIQSHYLGCSVFRGTEKGVNVLIITIKNTMFLYLFSF